MYRSKERIQIPRVLPSQEPSWALYWKEEFRRQRLPCLPSPFQKRVARLRLLPSLYIPSQCICRPIWKSAFSPTGVAELRQATDADSGGSSPAARTPQPAQRNQGVPAISSPCPPLTTRLSQFSFPQCGTGFSTFGSCSPVDTSFLCSVCFTVFTTADPKE